MARRIEFEGRIIDVPDDATDDEVAEILNNAAPSADAITRNVTPQRMAPTAQPGGNWFENPGKALKLGLQNVGSGAANVAGAPVDIMAGLQNALTAIPNAFGANLPFVTKPVGGSEFIKDAASAIFSRMGAAPVPKEQQSPGQQRLGKMIDFGTQAALGGGALAANAPALAARVASGSAAPAATTGGRVADAFVRPYIQNPASTFAGDVAAGVGAGVGSDVAERFAPDSPIAQVFGQLAGGIGGAALKEVAGMAGRGVASIPGRFMSDPNVPVDPVTGAPVSRRMADSAARWLQELAVNPRTAGRDIAENAANFRAMDAPVPTSGLLTNDPGMNAAETAARTQRGVPFVVNDNKLRAAATSRVEGMRDPTIDQGRLNVRAGQYADEQMRPANEAVTAAEQQQAEIARRRSEAAAPFANMDSRTSEAASRNLDRAVIGQTYIPDRARKNELYRQTDPTLPVDTSGMARAAGAAQADVANLPPSMQGRRAPVATLNDLAETPEMPYGAAAATRQELQGMEADARRNSQFGQADVLRDVRRPLQQSIDAANPEAAANYRDNFAPRYRVGEGDAATDFTRAVDRDPNRTATPPSQTAERFLTRPEDADSLNRILANSPSREAAEAAVRDYLRADFAKVARGGALNPQQAQQWLNVNAAVLDRFPALRGEFGDLAQSAQSGARLAETAEQGLSAAQAARTGAQRRVDGSVAGSLINGRTPREVADRILSSQYGAERQIDDVQRVIGKDPEAQRAWRAAVADVMADRVNKVARSGSNTAGPGPAVETSLGALERVFKEQESTLARVFGAEGMSALRQAHAILEPLKNATLRATTGSNTADKYATVAKLGEAGLKLKFGALKGGGIMRSIRLMAETLPDDGKQIETIIQRAWFNPELAAYLLQKQLPNASGPVSNTRLRSLLLGQRAGAESTEEENKP